MEKENYQPYQKMMAKASEEISGKSSYNFLVFIFFLLMFLLFNQKESLVTPRLIVDVFNLYTS